MTGTRHFMDNGFCWPACGAVHQEVLIVHDPAQVTCGSCKKSVSYREAVRDAIIERSKRMLSNEQLAALVRVSLARIVGSPRDPSNEQVVTVGEAITMWEDTDAVLLFSMDEDDGTLLVSLTDDGLTQHARFKRDGKMEGSWF